MNSATSKTEYLRITDLHAYYGESHILHGIDMKVDKGECVTLLGRNGSGRSTTLKSIMGLVGRRSGSIMLNGTEIINVPTHKTVSDSVLRSVRFFPRFPRRKILRWRLSWPAAA